MCSILGSLIKFKHLVILTNNIQIVYLVFEFNWETHLKKQIEKPNVLYLIFTLSNSPYHLLIAFFLLKPIFIANKYLLIFKLQICPNEWQN